jgi:predicted ferric reductase
MRQSFTLPERGRPSVPLWAAGTLIVAGAIGGLVAAAARADAPLSPLTWYLARASGFTLYLLFWFTVVSGLGMTTKLLGALGRDGAHWLVHRYATELAFVALVVHILALALDPVVPLGVAGVLLPFVSAVRQPWTDLGIISAWGMLAVAVSYGMRRVLGGTGWRALHYAAFPLWFGGLLHGVGAGSDTGEFWALGVYLPTASVVICLSLYRLLRAGQRGRHPVTHPAAIRDREVMRRRVAAYRERCASLSSKTNASSPT